MAKLTFYGGVNEIGGNKVLVILGSLSILVLIILRVGLRLEL
jgi:hypothetical protein